MMGTDFWDTPYTPYWRDKHCDVDFVYKALQLT